MSIKSGEDHESKNLSFFPWKPSIAEQTAILMGTDMPRDPKLVQMPSSLTATAASVSSQSLGRQINALLTSASSPSIGIADFGHAKEYEDATTSEATTPSVNPQSLRFYQYSRVLDSAEIDDICFVRQTKVKPNMLQYCQILVQPSLLPGNTVIRYLNNGQPESACMYLRKFHRGYDNRSSNPNGDYIYLNLTWKPIDFDVIAAIKTVTPLSDHPIIKTFEKLAKELADKEAADRKNAADKASSGVTFLLSSAAQFATRVFSWNSAASPQTATQTASQAATQRATAVQSTAAATPQNPNASRWQCNWLSQCTNKKMKRK